VSIQRTVSFDGSNVDFGNPLYSEINNDKLDMTPAYDDNSNNSKKYMPAVGEVTSQPYSTDIPSAKA